MATDLCEGSGRPPLDKFPRAIGTCPVCDRKVTLSQVKLDRSANDLDNLRCHDHPPAPAWTIDANGRVTRTKTDQVGNNLTAHLAWCETHLEPVWVFDDGSFGCPYDCVTEMHSDDHAIGLPPWERAR